MSTAEHLAFAAAKAATRPEYISFYLSEFRRSERISEEEMVDHLRCDVADYYRLCLATAPDFQDPSFGAEVRRIATWSGAPFSELLSILRRAHSLLTIATAEPEPARWLAAARDKTSSEPTREE